MKAYAAFKSSTYTLEYYMNKLNAGFGKIGADCSGAFAPLEGSDNTVAGYYAGCIEKCKLITMLVDKPCMLFKRNSSGTINHIGWYRPEDGTVSEMASRTLNFKRRRLSSNGWTDWGIPKFIDYYKLEKVRFYKKNESIIRRVRIVKSLILSSILMKPLKIRLKK